MVSCMSGQRLMLQQSYMWVYRSVEGSPERIVLFEYQPGRGQQHPQAFLQGYAGTLMTDGYSAWRTLDGATHLGCMAHARRYFDEAAKVQGKTDGRARQSLEMIGRSRAEYTCSLRQQHSLAVLAVLKGWLDKQSAQVLPKSLLGEAITYMRNQWIYLSRYTDDGNAPIDNNAVERDIRPFTAGRKTGCLATPSSARRPVQRSTV